jgi:hypothetical protein
MFPITVKLEFDTEVQMYSNNTGRLTHSRTFRSSTVSYFMWRWDSETRQVKLDQSKAGAPSEVMACLIEQLLTEAYSSKLCVSIVNILEK